MVTLATLGLVERGQTAGKNIRPCFRLTELGRVVFGAPEVEAAQKPGDARFLTVQPNLEVVAYLESADARQICTLSRFAAVASRAERPRPDIRAPPRIRIRGAGIRHDPR